jgi:hypothetical protein
MGGTLGPYPSSRCYEDGFGGMQMQMQGDTIVRRNPVFGQKKTIEL